MTPRHVRSRYHLKTPNVAWTAPGQRRSALAAAPNDRPMSRGMKLLATDGDTSHKSDPNDIAHLASAAGLHVEIVPVLSQIPSCFNKQVRNGSLSTSGRRTG